MDESIAKKKWSGKYCSSPKNKSLNEEMKLAVCSFCSSVLFAAFEYSHLCWYLVGGTHLFLLHHFLGNYA